MPGQRYVDWTHIRVEGDRDAAAPYLGEARKLLGAVMEQAAVNGLGVHALHRRLNDGTVIIAEKHGEIPRITIVPVGVEEGRPRRPGGDFVVWARNEELPDGIHEVYPQQILQVDDGDWRTFFYSGNAEGYEDFRGAKGVYAGMFPQGLRRAGNLDWAGRRGERLSWYGPSTRYWYDNYVQMTAQYGRLVFMLGQVVLDTDQYIADSAVAPDPQPAFNERYVLGAGMRGAWLYVVQVQAHQLDMPPPDPTVVGTPGNPYYFFSVGYTPAPVDTVVCRYRLIPHPDESPGYRVAAKSREVIWSGEIERGVNPWFFNPDCTEAITFLPPDIQAYGSSTFVPVFDESTTQKVLTLTHPSNPAMTPSGIITDTEVSLEPGGGEAPIAADYLPDGSRVEVRIRRRNLGLPTNATGFLSQRFDILCGGAAAELRSLEREAPTANHFDMRRWVMWADARESALVTRRQLVHFRDPPGSSDPFVSMQVWLEVWVRGVKLLDRTDGRTDISEDNNSFGVAIFYNSNTNDRQSDNLHQALAPMLPLYGWCWGNTPLLTPHQICGQHTGFCYLPRQPAQYFGWVLTGRLDGAGNDIPSTHRIVAERVNAPPAAEKLDVDGMDSVLGAASTDGVAILSAYPKGTGLKPAEHAVLPGPPLPDLTGVPAPLERYHPIWLLGRPPIATQ